ncbi:MarR family winged helix-turn-helix transcriptional regulator [Kluyvera sichuanensis]|uniref:MarR family winged helix-turn-helix transcriptional regulator n=1 Tax=Kluyvera sichuanensis TaxID=2725494 RepID=UPI0039F5A1D0
MKNAPGLGELLRYTAELIDSGSEAAYREMSLNYRPRYTPVLRALAAGAMTVTDITAMTHLTQGAVSQSVSLMEQDGILRRGPLEDGRKSGLHLTNSGEVLVSQLKSHWQTLFTAIHQLEKEVGWPLLQVLEQTAKALEEKDFAQRIVEAKVWGGSL